MHIKETMGVRITPDNRADYEQAVKIAKAVYGFSGACGMTPDKMEVNMANFVSAALKEVGWDMVKSQMIRSAESKQREIEMELFEGDIVSAPAEALVCPSNPGFTYGGGSGVNRAIAVKYGMEVFQKARKAA